MSWVDDDNVSKEFAQELVGACASWDHPKAHTWVLAPAHAKRIFKGFHGWAIEFGANSFLIEKAIERSRRLIKRRLAGEAIDDETLLQWLQNCIADSVANNGSEYNGRYPVERTGVMRFGTSGIDVERAAKFLISRAGLGPKRNTNE